MGVIAQTVVEAAVQSHTGRVRRANQDAWAYAQAAGVFVVCDGMGGAAGGEVASQLAAEAFIEQLSRFTEDQRNSRALAQAVHVSNTRVFTRASAEAGLRGMGTTLVGLATRSRGRVIIVHVGDSRCYRLRGGELLRCTEDHSLVAEQLRMGLLTPEEAARTPLQHVITRALGTRRSVEAEVRTMDAERGDTFLLCTDGLTRELAETQIAEIAGRTGDSLAQRSAELVDTALKAGGRDNVTCLLVTLA